MRVALVMCPMRYRTTTTWFEALHNLSKGEPQFIRFFNEVRKKGLIDFRSYPLGPICLATTVKDIHQVRIFNFLDGNTRLTDLTAFAPEVVSFTCSTGSALIWVAETAEYIKKICGSTIILGGPHVTLDPLISLTTTVADFVVAGEGDFVFKELLAHIAGNGRLPRTGVWCRRNGSIHSSSPATVSDMSLLSVPDHSLVDQSRYRGVHIETSRGCSYACDFCFLSGMPQNHAYRLKPVEAVVAELKAIAGLRDLSKSKIYIVDSNFRSNERILDLMFALRQEQIKAEFWTASDTYLSPEALRAMKERGFFFLHSGIEDGISGRFPKIVDRQHLFSFVKQVYAQGLTFGADFILGYPEQKPKDLKGAVLLASQICKLALRKQQGPKITFQPHFFRPFPNTPVVNRLIQKGWVAPKTFKAWGQLHDGISRGIILPESRLNYLSLGSLTKTMLFFILLNSRYFLLPLALIKLRQSVVYVLKLNFLIKEKSKNESRGFL